jgi:hypothetical protein
MASGEPCALKGARTVREGIVGSAPFGTRRYLLHLVGRRFKSYWAHLQDVSFEKEPATAKCFINTLAVAGSFLGRSNGNK